MLSSKYMEQNQKINQNFQYPSSSPLTIEDVLGSGLSVKRFSSIQDVIDFYRTEIIELREEIAGLRTEDVEFRGRIENLEKQLEQKAEQRIIPINFLESDKLKFKKSFNVVLEYYSKDNLYIIDCPELNIYGEGQDETLALDDFKTALEETYFSLKEDKDRLGPRPKKEWGILADLIEEK